MRKIQVSNLCLRFYVHDGWTSDLIREYFPVGEIRFPFPEDALPYYIFDHAKQIIPNKKKILEECQIEIGWFWSEREKARSQEQILDDYLR